MTIECRIFNEIGQKRYIQLLQSKPVDLVEQVSHLCSLNEFTVSLGVNIELPPFVSRGDLAHHIDDWFESNPTKISYAGSSLFWDWIAGSWMKTLVMADPRYVNIGTIALPQAAKIVGSEYQRWALTEGTTHYHRHLVSNPYFSLVANRDNEKGALCLLESNVCEPGEVVERIAGTSKFNSGSVCQLATLLYVDLSTGKRRSKFSVSPGNPKAFSYYFGQIDLTVDYKSMTVDQLLDLLPSNFESRVALARADLDTLRRET